MVAGKNQGSFWEHDLLIRTKMDIGSSRKTVHAFDPKAQVDKSSFVQMQTSGKKSRVCKAFGRLRLTAPVCVCCPPPSLPLFSDSNCCSVALIPNGQGLGSNRRPLHNLDTDTEGREPWQRESAVKYIEHFKSQWCIRCRQPPECDHIMVSSSLFGLTSDQETFQTINTVVSSAWNWSGGAHDHFWPITSLPDFCISGYFHVSGYTNT